MKQKYFAVLNSSDPKVGELKIYGVIGGYWWDDDSTSANSFVNAFNALEKTCERINIHINSPGGSVHEGLPIVTAIQSSAREVHTYVVGIAFSMGAMIAMAAKKGNVHMAKGSLMMVHSVSTSVYGNAQALRDEAAVLDKYDDVLNGLIAHRTGKSTDDVKAVYLNHKDNYYTPEEAIAEGLADVVEDYSASDAPDNVRNMSHGQVAAWFAAQGDEPSESFLQKVTNRLKSVINGDNTNSTDMFGNKFSKLGALAKVAVESITAQQLEDINAQIVEAGVVGVTIVLDSELEDKANELIKLQGDKDALVAEKSVLAQQVSDKDARIAELEAEVKALGGKPADEPAKVVTDKVDDPGTGEGKEVEDFTTEYDREAQAFFGK